jgi:hypothetical protein
VEIFCSLSKIIDEFSIHPRTKLDVGYRLSRSGLAVAYGQQVEFQGPIVQSVDYLTEGTTVNITYTAVSNIEIRNPNGFEVYYLSVFFVFKYLLFRFVVTTLNVRMMLSGFQPLY